VVSIIYLINTLIGVNCSFFSYDEIHCSVSFDCLCFDLDLVCRYSLYAIMCNELKLNI
jgi:hypothetical protein